MDGRKRSETPRRIVRKSVSSLMPRRKTSNVEKKSKEKESPTEIENPTLRRISMWENSAEPPGQKKSRRISQQESEGSRHTTINRRKRATSDINRSRRKSIVHNLASVPDERAASNCVPDIIIENENADAPRRRDNNNIGAQTMYITRRKKPLMPQIDLSGDENEDEDDERDAHQKKTQEKDSKDSAGLTAKNKEQQVSKYRIIAFITFLATEHEYLLQVLMVLPLTLMALYIVLIEKGELFRIVEK